MVVVTDQLADVTVNYYYYIFFFILRPMTLKSAKVFFFFSFFLKLLFNEKKNWAVSEHTHRPVVSLVKWVVFCSYMPKVSI